MRGRTLIVLSLGLTFACSRTGLEDLNLGGSLDGGAGIAGAIGSGGRGGSIAAGSGGRAPGTGGNLGAGGSTGRGGFGALVGSGGTGVTGGSSGTCVVNADCVVQDPCLLPRCVANGCAFVSRDADQDGYTPFACGGDDCDDHNPSAHPRVPEQCTDGIDNDCNGLVDCDDPECKGMAGCGR